MTRLAKVDELMATKQWSEAAQLCEALMAEGLVYPARDGLLEKAAIAYQQMGAREKELKAMKLVNELSSDALFALKPLMEQAKTDQDWEAMLTYANKWLSIQPLQAYGHEQLAEAAMKLERPKQALSSLQSLRSLGPADPAGLSLKLAQNALEARRCGGCETCGARSSRNRSPVS